MIEHIHKKKAERVRAKELSDQADAMRQRKRDARLRREKRQEDKKVAALNSIKEDALKKIDASTKEAVSARPTPKVASKTEEPKPKEVEPQPVQTKAAVPTPMETEPVTVSVPKESKVKKAPSKVAPPPKIPTAKTPAPPPKIPTPGETKATGSKKSKR